ncbi:unnamed protein product [Effrenium voratum]|nr:unnamed protein product [Effrenium voratum]
MLGAGVMSLPYVFGKVGLALAVPGYLLVAAICCFSVWRIIQCQAMLGTGLEMEVCQMPQIPFGAASPCAASPRASPALRWESPCMQGHDYGLGPLARVAGLCLGPSGVFVAAAGIIISQLGFCVAYIDIIVSTLSQHLLGASVSEATLRLVLAVMLCLLSTLRRLSSLAKVSSLALGIYAYLLLALLRWGSLEMLSGRAPSAEGAWRKMELGSLGQWLGTAIFAQEAMVVSQVVYEEMKPKNHRDFLPVLLCSFAVCSVLSTFLAAFGYMAYGDSVKQVFYLNFPSDSFDVILAESILCLVLLPTFVLQMYPVARFLDDLFNLDDDSYGREGSLVGPLLVRWLLVLLSSSLAADGW